MEDGWKEALGDCGSLVFVSSFLQSMDPKDQNGVIHNHYVEAQLKKARIARRFGRICGSQVPNPTCQECQQPPYRAGPFSPRHGGSAGLSAAGLAAEPGALRVGHLVEPHRGVATPSEGIDWSPGSVQSGDVKLGRTPCRLLLGQVRVET